MRNIDVKDDEEDFIAAMLGYCEVWRKAAEDNPHKAAILKDLVLKKIDNMRQSIWDSMPDKIKRQVLSERPAEEEQRPKKKRDKPSQAFEAPTDFIP